jgi:hypothetical protein
MKKENKVMVDIKGLSKAIRKLGRSYSTENTSPEQGGMVAFTAGDVKNKFHNILRKFGINEYEPSDSGNENAWTTTYEYIMLKNYLLECLFEEGKLHFNLAMMCFKVDGDFDDVHISKP